MEINQVQVEESVETYESRLSALSKILPIFEVFVRSYRYGINHRFEARSIEEVREFVSAAVEAARKTHDEEIVVPRYCDEYEGVKNLVSDEDEEFQSRGWSLSVYSLFAPSRRDPEVPESNRQFVYGHRYGANRVANPSSKVFVYYGGRDCDGLSWSSVSEFADLHEAAQGTDSRFESADGPMWWRVASKEEFEGFGRSY